MDIAGINSAMIRDIVETIPNHNSRKRLFIVARSFFRDLAICQDLPYLEGAGRMNDMLTQERLKWLIEESAYRPQLLLCRHGGLRVSEACAVTLENLRAITWM